MQPAAGHHRSGLEAVLLAAVARFTHLRHGGRSRRRGGGRGLLRRRPLQDGAGRARRARPGADRLRAGRAGARRPTSASPTGSGSSPPTSPRRRPNASRPAPAATSPTMSSSTRRSTTAPAAPARPQRARASAHVLAAGGLDPWLRAAASVLKFGGDVTVIFRADGLADLLAAAARRFGGAEIMPVLPRPETAGAPHPRPRRQGQPGGAQGAAAAGPARRGGQRLHAGRRGDAPRGPGAVERQSRLASAAAHAHLEMGAKRSTEVENAPEFPFEGETR